MKNFLFKLKLLLALVPFWTVFNSCSGDDSVDIPTVSENIAQLVNNNPNLSVLATAIGRANLTATLASNGPVTLLAPTNAAWGSFLALNGFSGIEQVPVETLTQLLLHHVLEGQFPTTDFIAFKAGYINTKAAGLSAGKTLNLFFNADQGVGASGTPVITFNGGGKIVASGANRNASNGIIQEVDAVIEFATVSDFIVLDGNLAAMQAAMESNGQPDFITLLDTPTGSGQAPFTVFVPRNTAFLLVPAGTPANELTAILNHHIIAGNNIISQAITNNLVSPPTLEGDTLLFAVSGVSISITDGVGNVNTDIEVFNLQAANGIVHVTNRVLIPNISN